MMSSQAVLTGKKHMFTRALLPECKLDGVKPSGGKAKLDDGCSWDARLIIYYSITLHC